jgi:hypothetical protein
MSAEALKKEFVPKFLSAGEPKFYRFLLLYSLNKLIYIEKGTYKGTSPELEFLDYHDQFIILYRREGEEIYLDLARVFRKAAHKTYRIIISCTNSSRNSKNRFYYYQCSSYYFLYFRRN